jgi:hypothetical protein
LQLGKVVSPARVIMVLTKSDQDLKELPGRKGLRCAVDDTRLKEDDNDGMNSYSTQMKTFHSF